MAVRIMGTGSALPRKRVDNQRMEQLVETSDEWIRERTGIASRYVSTGETVAELGAEAALKALEDAGEKPEVVELLLVATCSPERAIPSVACQVQGRIGAVNAVAMDLNGACAGFLFALHTAWAYIEAGVCERALVIGAEVLSKLVDFQDRGTCILFGDGAGAVLVKKSEKGGLLAFAQHSDGSRGEVLRCDTRALQSPFAHGTMEAPYIRMEGKEVFSFAVRQVPEVIREALGKADKKAEEVDLFFLHQANRRILEGIAKRLEVEQEKFPTNLERVGNMSSAAIPVLLDEWNKAGKIEPGAVLVLSGFGAGLTWGACVLIW